MARRGEFELIARLFAPLSDTDRGLGLIDDASLLRPDPGFDLVVTTDTIVAGVHYLADDPPDLIARKLLRVNLSDLAAMGATPLGYLLNLTVASDMDDPWLDAFAAGLAADQHAFGATLLGGDTVRTPGPGTLSVTAFGQVGVGRALRRSGARQGERIFVSGTLGDAALGLQVLQGAIGTGAGAEYLIERYRLPAPRVDLGPRLLGLASAAIDVSDGLVADLGHICEASGTGAVVRAADVPVSAPARALLDEGKATQAQVLTGGDDYELLFTAPVEVAGVLDRIAAELDLTLTDIGEVTQGKGVRVLAENGSEMKLARGGHTHF